MLRSIQPTASPKVSSAFQPPQLPQLPQLSQPRQMVLVAAALVLFSGCSSIYPRYPSTQCVPQGAFQLSTTTEVVPFTTEFWGKPRMISVYFHRQWQSEREQSDGFLEKVVIAERGYQGAAAPIGLPVIEHVDSANVQLYSPGPGFYSLLIPHGVGGSHTSILNFSGFCYTSLKTIPTVTSVPPRAATSRVVPRVRKLPTKVSPPREISAPVVQTKPLPKLVPFVEHPPQPAAKLADPVDKKPPQPVIETPAKSPPAEDAAAAP